MRKSDVTLTARNEFVAEYGLNTLRALAVLRKQSVGAVVDGTVGFSAGSLAAYKANLTRGAYRPYVGPNFARDKLNLVNCNR